MKVNTGKFMIWLMGLTNFMRYLVIAILFHVVILFVLGSIKIVTEIPRIIAGFGGALPPAKENVDDVDPFAALRNFEYKGPTLGGGGGTPGTGPGGIPTAAGTTPTEYKTAIMAPDQSDNQAAEVIGVLSESASAVARLQGSVGGLAAPTTGFGEGKIGTAGVKGPGGGGFGQRVGPMRAQLISKNKGTQETERAVLGALRWLKEHQNPDGSWGGQHREAYSAFATLAFLGHGETPDSGEFGPTVSKALEFLVNSVSPAGTVTVGSGYMYYQGAVTLALAEAYGMTQSPAVKDPLDRAVAAILLSQKVKKTDERHVGGWRYYPTSADSDTSVSGWLIMGLKSARLAGVEVGDEPFELASKFLWNTYNNEKGGFGYDPATAPSLNMTGVGVLCQQFLGHGDDPRIKKALDFLKTDKFDWQKPSSGHSLYGWYYMTQAMFQGGGSHWEYWNKQMRKTLVENQAADGHWDVPPASGEGAYGPAYSTALCCLMLEVYYRYLPTYQEMEKKALPQMPGAPRAP